MGGVSCIAGTRIPVTTILGLLRQGVTPDEIICYYPQLVIADVEACVQAATQSTNQQGLEKQ